MIAQNFPSNRFSMVPEANGLISSVFIREIKEKIKKFNNKLKGTLFKKLFEIFINMNNEEKLKNVFKGILF